MPPAPSPVKPAPAELASAARARGAAGAGSSNGRRGSPPPAAGAGASAAGKDALPADAAPAAAAPPLKREGSEVRSREESPEAPPTERISCVECRRLKRKCDRIHPCNQCRRYDKTCVFPQPEVLRRGKKYMAEVRARVDRLERLLAKYAPHVSLEHLGDDDHSPPLTDTGGGSQDPPVAPTIPPLTAPSFAGMPPAAAYSAPPGHHMSDERGRPLPVAHAGHAAHGRTPPGPIDFLPSMGLPSPAVPSISPSSSIGAFEHSSATASGSMMPPPPSRSHSQHRGGGGDASQRGVQTPSADDKYEWHARDAQGYEYNERHLQCDHDGTASLSVESSGQGYLGFAAGTTLLRFLQIASGRIKLDHIKSNPEPQAPQHWVPTTHEEDKFIDAYFEHYHMQYPILHESSFRAQLGGVIPRPLPFQWELLYNVVLGLGAFCHSQPMYVIDYFLERAIKVISVEHLEAGSLPLVQAFTLLSNLAQKRNKLNSGSTYLGIAVRMAVALGLHKELPMWQISPFEREVRRRVWWVLFIFDSGASITFGRPILLPFQQADVDPPKNLNDRDFTPKSKVMPAESKGNTLYTALITQSGFVAASNWMYNQILVAKPPPPYSELLMMDNELQAWWASVPPCMKASASPQEFRDTPWLYFSAHKLQWRYNNMRFIVARHAFLERALIRAPLAPTSPLTELDVDPLSLDAEERKERLQRDAEERKLAGICLSCAIDTIYDIHGFFKGRTLNRLECWYGLHFLFQAAFVPLIALCADQSSHERTTWKEAVHLACDTMRSVQADPLADRCLRMIDAIMDKAVPEDLAPSATSVLNSSFNNGLMELFNFNPSSTYNSYLNNDDLFNMLPYADLTTLDNLFPPDLFPQDMTYTDV